MIIAITCLIVIIILLIMQAIVVGTYVNVSKKTLSVIEQLTKDNNNHLSPELDNKLNDLKKSIQRANLDVIESSESFNELSSKLDKLENELNKLNDELVDDLTKLNVVNESSENNEDQPVESEVQNVVLNEELILEHISQEQPEQASEEQLELFDVVNDELVVNNELVIDDYKPTSLSDLLNDYNNNFSSLLDQFEGYEPKEENLNDVIDESFHYEHTLPEEAYVDSLSNVSDFESLSQSIDNIVEKEPLQDDI